MDLQDMTDLIYARDAYRLNGEEIMMGKYKFPKELKEAVLIGRINGKASVIIDGVSKVVSKIA